MASSKLMASSTSQDSDLKSKLSVSASTSATDFLKIDNAAGMMDGVSRSKRKSGHERVGEAESSCESDPPRAVRKTVDDVWKEIIEGKKRRQQPKEEMMTLEDFLMKAGAAEETRGVVDVKEEGSSGGIYAYESNSGVIGAEGVMGLDVGGLGRGRGKRSVSLLEPLDKAAQQRQRRMIKNRESAARSRERKQVGILVFWMVCCFHFSLLMMFFFFL